MNVMFVQTDPFLNTIDIFERLDHTDRGFQLVCTFKQRRNTNWLTRCMSTQYVYTGITAGHSISLQLRPLYCDSFLLGLLSQRLSQYLTRHRSWYFCHELYSSPKLHVGCYTF